MKKKSYKGRYKMSGKSQVRPAPPQYRSNICFDCARAVGGCPWSRRFEPVPGWKAKAITRSLGTNKGEYDGHLVDTYEITACPLFEAEKNEPLVVEE